MHPLRPHTVCYLQGTPGRFRREPPPDDGDDRERHRPLSQREKIVYSLFAGWGCLTFVLLALVIVIAHSPLVAN